MLVMPPVVLVMLMVFVFVMLMLALFGPRWHGQRQSNGGGKQYDEQLPHGEFFS